MGFLAFKTYNLSTFFGEVKQTNFLDFTVSLFDFLVIFLLIIFILNQFQTILFKDKLKAYLKKTWVFWLFSGFILLGLIQILLNQILILQNKFEIVWIWKLIITSARLTLVIASFNAILKTSVLSQFSKNFFFLSVFLALFFDKFLLYNPQPTFFMGIVCLPILFFKSQKTLKNPEEYKFQIPQISKFFNTSPTLKMLALFCILYLYFLLCFITQIYQITTSTSLGLNFLGESVLSLGTLGVAREKIGDFEFLRGYGLAEHASIMGFMGLMGMSFWQSFKGAFLTKNTFFSPNIFPNLLPNFFKSKFLNWVFEHGFLILTVATSLLSLSRSVLFVALVFGLFLTYKNLSLTLFKQAQKVMLYFSITLICLVFATFLVWQNLNLRSQSNQMRVDELQTYQEVFEKMNWNQKLFGLGLAQYPYFLRQNFNTQIPYYSAYPVHNTFLSVLVDIGILPTLVLLYLMVFPRSKKFNLNSKS